MSENHWLRIPPEMQVESRLTWTIAVSSDQRALGASYMLLNRPCESLGRLTAAEWMDLHSHIQRVEKALDDLLAPDAYEHTFTSKGARQMYMQVLPRYQSPRTWSGETFTYDEWGRPRQWPQQLSPEALRELRDAIRARLPAVV
jgi:diadenosine tetraphosphate (Ap4A) HIT family hydrolase